MKRKYILTAVSALIISGACFAAEPAKKVSDETMKLIKEAQAVSKTNKPEETVAAYEKVFKADDLTPEQKMNAYLDIARVYTVKDKYDLAEAEYDKALAIENLSQPHKVRLMNEKAKMWLNSNFKGAYATYFNNGIEKAAWIYRGMLKSPDLTNSDKIAVYNSLANCSLEVMDVPAANKLLDEAIALPGLNETEILTAKKNKADALLRQLEYDKALSLYREIYGEKVPAKANIESQIVRILLLQKKDSEAEKALESYKLSPLATAAFFMENGKEEKSVRMYEKMIADKSVSFKDRSECVEKLLQYYGREKNLKTFFETADKYIPALIAEDEKAWQIYPRFFSWHYNRLNLNKNDDFVKWAAEKVLSAPKVAPADFAKCNDMLFNLALKKHDLATAKNIVSKMLSVKELDPKTKLNYELCQAVLDSNGKKSGAVEKVNAAIKANGIKDDDGKAKAEALLSAARTAMNAEYFDVAKEIYAAREKMLVPEPPRSITCQFLKNGPKDITEFMNSDYFKNKKNRAALDRKYGDNLQFLLDTDAALTSRKVTEKSAEFTPTEFVTSCDENGVYFFFFAPTAKAKDLADGLTGMGGYETYLAAGTDEPYHCYLIDMPDRISDGFVTQYNNKDFRRTNRKDNTLNFTSRVYDNGVASLLFVSWDAFFNKLPKDGDKWDFEPIHWEQGGYSWGGSKSVHNRSSFGNVVFANMTKENLNAIKRRLISKAANAYRKELSAQNGYVEIWQDPELGDQKFYLEKVKPLQTELDGYLAQVKPGMTAEDVEFLYEKAVPQWMNIKFIVAEMRRDYLDEQFVGGK